MTLRDHGLAIDIRRLCCPIEKGGGKVPADLDNVHGVISLGGDQNVGEDHPWMDAELTFLKKAHEAELPVVGICFGAQLIAHALGGVVAPMEKPEWGMETISFNHLGQTDPVLAGLPWDGPWFASHCHEITELPQDAVCLGSSKACNNHIFRAGIRTFGFQFHPETDREGIITYAASQSETLKKAAQSMQNLEKQLDAHYDMFSRMADRLCLSLVSKCFGLKRTMSA